MINIVSGLEGVADRKLAKRPTMTTPYGVTRMGLKEQIYEVLEAEPSYGIPVGQINEVANYLAGIFKQAVGETVIAANTVMTWLQEVAKIVASEELPVWWTTPMGMPVVQDYKKTTAQRVDVWFLGSRTKVTIRAGTDKADKQRQSLGIAPNVIHSLDAAHMQRTINMCSEDGIRHLSFIHDSYGTHAANTGRLAYWLREAFIEQYTQVDVLQEFYEDMMRQLEFYPELKEKLPKPPQKGTLDLAQVRESKYFFA